MNKGSAAQVIDFIDLTSYNTGYAEGYEQCRMEYRQKIRERREAKYAEKRRRLYFLKQKLIGYYLNMWNRHIVRQTKSL